MTLAWDEELLQAVLDVGVDGLPSLPPGRDDWRGLRRFIDAGMAMISATMLDQKSIERQDFAVGSHDGAEVRIRWYAPQNHDYTAAGPGVVYLHGGGMISGSLDLYDRLVAGYVADSKVPMLSVDYRLAPEHPHPHPAEDCYAGLAWLSSRAADLGVSPARLAVMGDSAGGGLAAAVALLARDRSLPLAKQILIYPMLDDRTTRPDPALVPFATWTYDNNYTGWRALLGDRIGGGDVPYVAAPGRTTDFAGLASAYIEVGELDIFREECVAYAAALAATGVSAELHVHPGCPHGFDRMAPSAGVVRRARSDRLRLLGGL